MRSIVLLGIASLLGEMAVSAITAPSADAWCNVYHNRWHYDAYTLNVQTSIPAGWNTAISAARSGWNNVTNSKLKYYFAFNGNHPNVEFKLYQIDFSQVGLPDFPGHTANS